MELERLHSCILGLMEALAKDCVSEVQETEGRLQRIYPGIEEVIIVCIS